MPLDGKQAEIFERLFGPCVRQLPRQQQAPQRLRDFDIDQMRRVNPLLRVQHETGDRGRVNCSQNQFDRGRGVDNDQRRSRSSRMIEVGEMSPA